MARSEQRPFPVLHVHLGPAPPADAPAPTELMRDMRRRHRDEIRQTAVLAAASTPAGSELPVPADRIRTVAAGPRASVGPLPAGVHPRVLVAVGRALAELVEAPGGGRRAVQWPVPERWAVVHAHGAAALRAVWLAAGWRGRNPGLLASPLPGDASPPAGLWRKAELVAPPGRKSREALARRGVDRRRLRTLPPDDAGAHLRLYRRLAQGERRRVQRVDWTVAGPRRRGAPEGRGRR